MSTIVTIHLTAKDTKNIVNESSNETLKNDDLNSNSESKDGKTASTSNVGYCNDELIYGDVKTFEVNEGTADISEEPDFQDSNNCSNSEETDRMIPRPFQAATDVKCFYTFQERTRLNNQMHDCSICGRQFIYNSSLKSHVGAVHTAIIKESHVKSQVQTACTTCGKMFTNKNNMKTHIEAFHRSKTFDCGECRRRFKVRDDLVVHRYAYHCGQMYNCEKCDRKFDDKRNAKNHSEKCSGKAQRLVACRACGLKFSRKSVLKAHTTAAHTVQVHATGAFTCRVCKNNFGDKSDLVRHIDENHKLLSGKLACTICKKVFSNRPNRDAHMIIHKKINIIFACKFCDKTFKRKNDHYMHMHSNHNDNRVVKSKRNPSNKKESLKNLTFLSKENYDKTFAGKYENYSKRDSCSKTRTNAMDRSNSCQIPLRIITKKLLVLHIKPPGLCIRSEVGVVKCSASDIVLCTPLECL